MGNAHIDVTISATEPAHCRHSVCTVLTAYAERCSHNFTTWFARNRHTIRTLSVGVQGESPWPTFVAANAATNIVGHYICKHAIP